MSDHDMGDHSVKVKEYGISISMSFPLGHEVTDEEMANVRKQLDRNYAQARQAFPGVVWPNEYEFMTGPVIPIMDHSNGAPCRRSWNDEAICPHCEASIPIEFSDREIHQFGWYVCLQI
jgi:hypothetical protein